MNSTWKTPCLRGVMGNWVYYSTLMSAKQISARVITAKDIREAKALDDYLQRKLKPRVTKISTYLRKRDDRFFSSIILGVFGGLPDWIELDFSTIGQKLEITDLTPIEESFGLLIFYGTEKMFAIDGQHRIEGIKAAAKNNPDRFEHDEYPVLLVAHRDDAEGKVRTRRLFCDINKNAVAVSEGDKVVIDEDELSAIVTRRIYAEYPLFGYDNEIAVTEKKEQLVQDGRECFTSILAIHTVCKCLKKLYRKPRATLDNAPENINAFKAIVTEFLDFAIKYEPSLNRYFQQKSTTLKAERYNNQSLFFRPVGLEVLARLYEHFSGKNKLNILQYGLQKINFVNPGGVFDGVLWNAGKIDAKAKAKKIGVGLCLYVLHQLNSEQEAELTMALIEITKKADYSLPKKLKILLK
ncbi:MAG: DGQHR domain-containing protein [Deltaproteobacteria bacterium]|nr:DGQHR domain-containing protein [Deltaproteobacteria bacterium]